MPDSYSNYPKTKRDYYENMLKIIGSLSRLFSESPIPYLDSRVAENLFCKSFDAQNKSREDSSADAILGKMGIGIKTFRGKSAQKIAEFNKESLSLSSLQPLERAKRIAELRNKRIEFTKRNYAVDDLKYHCIIREKGKMLIFFKDFLNSDYLLNKALKVRTFKYMWCVTLLLCLQGNSAQQHENF